jgi:hypothetical protein
VQFEPARFLGRESRGTRNVPLPSHAPGNTRLARRGRWNRREIGVRKRLENGSDDGS